jgi:hypothetical protein
VAVVVGDTKEAAVVVEEQLKVQCYFKVKP